MRNTRDTFLHFLSDNLGGIPVHALRFDSTNPASDQIQGNAVNVHFLNSNFDVLISTQQVAIDIVHDDELTALDWAQSVANVLLAGAVAIKLDYSSGSPVTVGGWIYWNPTAKFRPVAETYYFRFGTQLTLNHHH